MKKPRIAPTSRKPVPGAIRGLLLLTLIGAAAGVGLRYFVLDRLAPRSFSYSIESCFRFRYAEMRMLGQPVPVRDGAAQWPEGFAVERMILPLPDMVTAMIYRASGARDSFLASRSAVLLFSAAAVLAFAVLALVVLRKPFPSAVATVAYAGLAAAYARTPGNYLREDFALPGLLIAMAGTVWLLTREDARREWIAAAAVSAATFWAAACWHMSQFCIACLALLIIFVASRGRMQAAAVAGTALWLGLLAAAAANTALWSKAAVFNIGATLPLAPAAGCVLGKVLRRPSWSRWFMLAAVAVLTALSALFGSPEDYAHVFALVWAKMAHLGIRPQPQALSAEARLYWVGPYNSPVLANFVLEYGVFALTSLGGFACLCRDIAGKRPVQDGIRLAALAGLGYLLLYLLMERMTIFVAPWAALASVYPLVRARTVKRQAVWLATLVPLWLLHLNGIAGFARLPSYDRCLAALAKKPAQVAWFYGSERARLLQWLARNAEPGAVLTDFAFSAQVLYLAGRPTALNPMFELPEPRRKAMDYAAAALAPEDELFRICRQWRIKYVVQFAPQVLDHGGGSFYAATGREPAPGSAAWLMQFAPDMLKNFRLVYETYSTRVYEAGRGYDGYMAPGYHPLFDSGTVPTVPPQQQLNALYAQIDEAQSLQRAGAAAEARRDFAGAAAAYARVQQLHPDFEDVDLRLGVCHLALQHNEEARTWLRRACQTAPDDPRAAQILATLP